MNFRLVEFFDDADYEIMYDESTDTFAYYDGHKYVKIPRSQDSEIRKEWEEWQRYEEDKAENPNLTRDEYEKRERSIQDASIMAQGAAEAEIENIKQKERIEQQKIDKLIKQRKNTHVASKSAAIREVCNEIKSFVENALIKEKVNTTTRNRSYTNPDNTMRLPGSKIIHKGKVRQHTTITKYSSSLPLILIYQDMSSSFRGSDNAWKLNYGKTLVSEFQQFADAGQIELSDILYFGSRGVSTQFQSMGGNNKGVVLVNDIRNRIKNRTCNIVVITDSDESTEGMTIDPIPLHGALWIIGVGSTPEELESNFIPQGSASKIKVFEIRNN